MLLTYLCIFSNLFHIFVFFLTVGQCYMNVYTYFNIVLKYTVCKCPVLSFSFFRYSICNAYPKNRFDFMFF